MEGVYDTRVSGSSLEIYVENHREHLTRILGLLTGQNVRINNIRIQESDLEDVFLKFTG